MNSLLLPLLAFVGAFPIEWSKDAPTDIPYEIEVSPAKLEKLAGFPHGCSYAVTATDAKGVRRALAVTELPGKTDDLRVLRFTVPSGTRTLTGRAAAQPAAKTAGPENLFAGALASTKGWKLPKGVTATARDGGILFESDVIGPCWVEYAVDVPEGAAGKPVKLEIDSTSRTPRLVWGGEMKVAQVDADGRRLPESVSDPRWTGHMRPPDKLVRYREAGRIHPRAKRLVFRVELRGLNIPYDSYGLPIRSREEKLAKLSLTHLALRTAATLPFPKYDDRFFVAGASGAEGDSALNLDSSSTFWYQTRGPAAWSEGVEYEGDGDAYFPVRGAGTVEAWFRPDWSAATDDGVFLFQGFQGFLISNQNGRNGLGEILGLRYWPKTGKVVLRLKDDTGKAFSGQGRAEIPEGRWTHVAVTWTPGARATVWVGGVARLRVPLTGFVEPDLADPKALSRNDRSATEFFVGASGTAARRETRTDPPKYGTVPFYAGAVDAVRVSSGERYTAGFKPAATYASDATTRAFFGFDRSYDGVSAYGLQHVSGTLLSPTDRLDHNLTVDGRKVAYFPAALPAANDPRETLDLNNYPDLPTEEDFRMLRRTVRRTFTLAKGRTESFAVEGRVYPDFIEIANPGPRPLVHPLVLNKGELDPRSFGDIKETLDLSGLDDRAKADTIFRFVLGASDYYRNHTVTFPAGSDRAANVEYEALTMLNGYCGFECGPLNNMTANLFSTVAGLPASQTLGYGHSFEQVFFDGHNHIYDLSAQKYFPAMDNETRASLADVDEQPYALNRLGNAAFNFARSGTRRFFVQNPSYREKVALTLNPGELFRAWFLNDGQVNDVHMAEPATPAGMRGECAAACAADPKGRAIRAVDRFFPHYGNGFLVFDGRPSAENPAFSKVQKDSFAYRVRSCYPIVAGTYSAELDDGAQAALEISTDFGATFRPLVSPATYAVRARVDYLVRVRAPIARVRRFLASTEVQFNPRIFPGRVKSGRNDFALRATSDGAAAVTVQYRVPDARQVTAGELLKSGVIPGCENLTLVMDPDKGLSVDLKGLSVAAKIVKTRGELTAKLTNGRLELASAAAKPFVGGVVVSDGAATRPLTVVACRGARVVRPAPGASTDRRFVFSGLDAAAKGTFALWTLTRGDGTRTQQERTLELVPRNPNAKRSPVGQRKNVDTELLKAPFGPKGGPSAWRWDYAHEHPGAYPYKDLRRFAASELTGELVIESVSAEKIEMQAILLLPYPDRDFRQALVKTLCGLNCQPLVVESQDGVAPVPASVAPSPSAPQVSSEFDTPPPGVKVPEFGRNRPPPNLAKRRELVSAVKPGELRARPTFVSCGVCWGEANEADPVTFRCRKVGRTEWEKSVAAIPFPETGDSRASLTGLAESTDYELEAVRGGRVCAATRFRTWSSAVPVAKTVVIDPATVRYPLVIEDRGTPKGWVRYVTKGGAPLGNAEMRQALVTVRNARCVLLDGITFVGGGGTSAAPLAVAASHGVRVCNCEFSGWGRTGDEEFRLLKDGRFGGGNRVDPLMPRGRGNFINYDAAIRIDRGCQEVVVERCYAHDPRGTANSWFYSHPHGPCAVFMVSPDHSTVIRWCDFIGGDDHRWNDAVEGAGNFKADGGFNQDADVYGNFMIFANDDCIELDGGMQNVRCFGNRFEGAVSGVSIQGCCASPVYVTDNLFSGLGEEHGLYNSSVKTSTLDPWWYRPYAEVSGNRYRDGKVFAPYPGDGARWHEADNVRISGEDQKLLAAYPVRPLPLTLDCGRLCVRTTQAAGLQTRTVKVRNASAKAVSFRVRKGADAAWLTVAPERATVPPHGEIALKVAFDPARLPDRARGCSAFLVRTAEGLSRGVSVYLERTDFENPRYPVAASARTVYQEPVAGKDGGWSATFDVKEAGDYWFFFRGVQVATNANRLMDSRVWVSIDGGAREKMSFRFWDDPTWTMVRPGKQGSYDGLTRHFALTPGTHRLTVWSRPEAPVRVDTMAVTDTPKAFEPRLLPGNGAGGRVR